MGNITDPYSFVLWVDEILVAVNKPAGLLVLPDGFDHQAPHLKSVLSPEYGTLWIVHRLDRDTSGVVLLARTEESHQMLNDQFANREIVKSYHALVVGNPTWEEKDVDLPLRPNGDRKHRTVIDPARGKPSLTRVRIMERFGSYTLVAAKPETGRPHQIRVHLASQGYPIVADKLYGDGEGLYLSRVKPDYRQSVSGEKELLARLGLHAASLTFKHPLTGEFICVEAPYPQDFSFALKQLRKYRMLT